MTLVSLCLQAASVEKWFAKDPTVVHFDDRLQYYYEMMDDVQNVPLVKDQDCIRLHMEPLAHAIKNHAKQWIDCYGKVLLESAKTGLSKLKTELDVRIAKEHTV